ncbi:glycosyltransferase [Desulfosediminicola flagellatus]|uniref:glycosyltransferase n=1 Tax=Desulfosediminicola flagellatus TaxID=2569541 RepID=UPI0010AC00CF|nr:glycosyltransferase [Desulfosediminicola flagellatus]
MKNVLVVAYAFPPIGGGGVQRVTKFVKYLRDYSWEPMVLTVANPSVPVIDQAMLDEIPHGISIFRAGSIEPSYAKKKTRSVSDPGIGIRLIKVLKNILSNILLPDVQILWWPGLIFKLIKIIRNEKPDCLFVTAPPFSTFIPVVAIGNIFKIPVVLDYRDEWSFSRSQLENASKNRFAKFLDQYLERYVVSKCDAITVATQSYLDSLVMLYPVNASKVTVITNGYDEQDFICGGFNDSSCNTSDITIIYSGTVWKATSLRTFCDALRLVFQNDDTTAAVLRLKIFGRVVDAELKYLEEFDSGKSIELLGYVEHKTLIEEFSSGDVLLLVLSDLPGANKIIAAKVFEYMATGKHIFAILPDGELKKLLSENYDNVTFAEAGNVDDIARKLLIISENIESIRKRKGVDISRFSRKELTGQLSKVFDQLI